MPELPEVESLRRGLVLRLKGQVVRVVTVRRPKLVSGRGNRRVASRRRVAEFVRELRGEKIVDITRRAKNLLFHFAGGKVLVAHLKMSGQFVYRENKQAAVMGGHPIELSEHVLPNKHTHVEFKLSRGTLYYNDPRMFGYLLYYPSITALEATGHFANLGLEPLDKKFTLARFAAALRAKKGKLKAVCMSQSVVTGLGNIYADEVCFAAGVHPARPVQILTALEIARLYKAIRSILLRAIHLGGSSVISYRLLDNTRGNYAREHQVYNRAGQPCLRCRRILLKTMVAGRTTVFCKHCQK